jgi:hypothetical protein
MLIRCPTCASGYDLAPELLTCGRILRCAYCRDAWAHSASGSDSRLAPETAAALRSAYVAPAGVEIVAEARFARPEGSSRAGGASRPAGPKPDHRREPPRKMAARPQRLGAAAATALVLTVWGGGMTAVAGREHVVAAFPPSAAVFATLGLPVNLRGLAIGEIRSVVETGDGTPILTLEGHITNLRRVSTPIPPLRFAVRDKDGRELYHWTSQAPTPQLRAGETILFHSRLSAPPRDGQDLAVSFAEASPAPRRVADAGAGTR